MTHGHHEHAHAVDDGLAPLLDLDAQVFATYWAAVLDTVHREAPPTTSIVDLGAGTGTGTFGLAERFADATVLAVDSDEQMLARIRTTAAERGLGGRVHTLHADLDAGVPDIGEVDVVWASMSLHHVADPDRVLVGVHATMRPGGLFAIAEFDAVVRFLPDDIGVGTPGLEERCLAALTEHRRETLPELGSDWPRRLTEAGFALAGQRDVDLGIDAPYPPGTAEYAHRWLDRMRTGVADDLDASDHAAFDALLDGGVLQALVAAGALRVRGERTLVLARR